MEHSSPGASDAGSGSRHRRPIGVAMLVLGLAIGICIPLLHDAYINRLATNAVILGITATSLNILVGYTGLPSFGHAAFFGSGAYIVGVLSLLGITSGFVGLPAAVLFAGLLAGAIGALSLRATGVFFIMITLAFAQMIYFAIIAVVPLGGDNGLHIDTSNLAGIDLKNGVALYYLSFAALIGAIYLSHRLVQSRFGRVLRGIRDNERRMISLGYAAYRYKLAAFVVSGGLAGFAGALYANLDAYASPELLHWTMSGDLLVMLILGGVGTLTGPALGAVAFVLLQELISSYTKYWALVFGPLLLIIVLLSNRGMLGLFTPRQRQPG